jgi:hypothetical protein
MQSSCCEIDRCYMNRRVRLITNATRIPSDSSIGHVVSPGLADTSRTEAFGTLAKTEEELGNVTVLCLAVLTHPAKRGTAINAQYVGTEVPLCPSGSQTWNCGITAP